MGCGLWVVGDGLWVVGCGLWVKNIVPNKNVIQGMDLVYSQTKSGRLDINYWKTDALYGTTGWELCVRLETAPTVFNLGFGGFGLWKM